MLEKSGFPLNNPLREKSVVIATGIKKTLTPVDDVDGKRERRFPKGGRERVKPAEAIILCQQCGRKQKVVFATGKTPEWHRCIWCGQLQPLDGYLVMGYGLGLPRPLSPHEVQVRAAELSRLHEGS